MRQVLVILIVLIAAGILTWQQIGPNVTTERVNGLVLSTEGDSLYFVREGEEMEVSVGDKIRRGEALKTKDGYAIVEFGGAQIVLAKNTEIIAVNKTDEQVHIRLLGGRIVTSPQVLVETKWITSVSQTRFSTVNYAFDRRVQILPMGARAIVENPTLGVVELDFPAEWHEDSLELVRDDASFEPENSAEAEFYAWAETVL